MLIDIKTTIRKRKCPFSKHSHIPSLSSREVVDNFSTNVSQFASSRKKFAASSPVEIIEINDSEDENDPDKHRESYEIARQRNQLSHSRRGIESAREGTETQS
jgi:hypothetical protein